MATSLATIKAPKIRMNRMDTYEILKLSRTVLFALMGILLIAIILGAQMHRDAMLAVGKDAAPSIIHAQHIKAALADMDADEANMLLAPPNTANSATRGVMQRRDEADEALLAASDNVTYEAERAPIETLQIVNGLYNRIAQESEDLHDACKPDVGGADACSLDAAKPDAIPMHLRYYQAMAILMDERLLPAADELDRANNDELQSTYRHQTTDSGLTTAFVVIVGLLALAALLAIQLFLRVRMRRTLNPPLLLATVATLLLFVYSLGVLITVQHRLKVAKEDSFESVHALWQARAIAYHLNAEESRALLDPRNAADHQRAFQAGVDKLAKLPSGLSAQSVVAKEARGERVGGFTGYLADELNNVTFPGEREAAVRALKAFEAYLQVDPETRRLESSGGQSDSAFARFDHALGETIQINQNEFDKAVNDGIASVGALGGHGLLKQIPYTLEFRALVLSAFAAVLIALGLAPRIKEYE